MSPENGNLSADPPSYITRGEGNSVDESLLEGREAYEALSDQELVRLTVMRRREALEVLYDRYARAVYSLAVNILRDGGAAEEATQDTFFNVWRRASSFRPERGKVATWLFSIGHHRVIDELRRRRRKQALTVEEVDLANQPGDAIDPAGYAIAQGLRREMRDALSVLRPEQREVVVLAYYGGLTHSEISDKLGQPLGTVKTRMRLALKKLRTVLGPRAQEGAEHGL